MRKDENTSRLCLLLLLSRGSFIASSSLSLTKCIVPNLFSVTAFLSVSWPVQVILAWKAHGEIEQFLGCSCLVTESLYTIFLLPLVYALAGGGYSYTSIFLFATRILILGVNSDWLLAFDPLREVMNLFSWHVLTCLCLGLEKFKTAILMCSWKLEQLEDGPFVIILS